MSNPKIYPGTIERAVDGDTFIISVDLGWEIYRSARIRINGIDCPSLKDPDESKKLVAKAAMDKAKSFEKKPCTIAAYGYDIYGRRLCDLFVDGLNYGQMMVSNKLAEPMKYSLAELDNGQEMSVV